MGVFSTQSSPTIRSPRLSLRPLGSDLDLQASLLSLDSSLGMGDALEEAPAPPVQEVKLAEAGFFDLQPPPSNPHSVQIEDVVKRLFSPEHLHFIIGDHALFFKFSTFLNRYRPTLVPTLVRYLEMRKALKAIDYANAVARNIRWPSHTDFCKFSRVQAASTDVRFEDYASRELTLLCSEALPAFVTYTCVGVIMDCVAKDITGQGVPVLQDLVGNLAEVFCLTDPSKHDNPIIFASEEFHRTTQYGTSYAIDRNCRFLQGPGTDKDVTLRLAKAVTMGQESNEILLNYRRDGTPFVNLLMCAPLYDDKGVVRYFIGAQVDITGLVEHGMGIESFRALLQKDEAKELEDLRTDSEKTSRENSWHVVKTKEALQNLTDLSTMLSQEESDVVNRNSRGSDEHAETSSINSGITASVKNRNISKRFISSDEPMSNGLNLSHMTLGTSANSTLPGVYKHYLLVRPYPSLQIMFVSPSLRLPGLLRSHLFSKLGGPTQTISALESAFRDGASVTAKVLWLPKKKSSGERGHAEAKPRHIRCTPLLGSDDRVGVWMVILVPMENDDHAEKIRRRHEVIDEMPNGRHRFRTSSRAGSVRGGQSVNGDSFDFGTGGRSRTPVRIGRGDNETELYAQYLRGSSSTGSSGESNLRSGPARKGSVSNMSETQRYSYRFEPEGQEDDEKVLMLMEDLLLDRKSSTIWKKEKWERLV